MKKLLITLAITMMVCVGAQATVQWAADFETPPYNLGWINGQQGWYSGTFTSGVVADGTTPDGSQALYIAGKLQGGDAIAYPNASADLVKVTMLMNGPTGAGGHAASHLRQGSKYFVMSEFQETSESGWGYYNIEGGNGTQYAGAEDAKLRWNAGTWEKVVYWLDFANDQYAAEINDVLIDEWYNNAGDLISSSVWTPFIQDVSGFDTWQIRISTMHDYAEATPFMVDGLMVEEGMTMPIIPEPSSMLLLGLGLLIARRKRS
jgi:PEP-CTERM motif